MSIQSVLFPLFVQITLTLVVMYTMAVRRFSAIRAGALRGPITLREPNWPTDALQAGYNYQNQFELPVLFYVLTILSIMTRHADLLFVVLAWLFVATRVVHAYIHLTSNSLPHRGFIFIAGAILLTIMWIIFMVRILLGLS
jgi:hypothetical protein